jgi:hypothetical protein
LGFERGAQLPFVWSFERGQRASSPESHKIFRRNFMASRFKRSAEFYPDFLIFLNH